MAFFIATLGYLVLWSTWADSYNLVIWTKGELVVPLAPFSALNSLFLQVALWYSVYACILVTLAIVGYLAFYFLRLACLNWYLWAKVSHLVLWAPLGALKCVGL